MEQTNHNKHDYDELNDKEIREARRTGRTCRHLSIEAFVDAADKLANGDNGRARSFFERGDIDWAGDPWAVTKERIQSGDQEALDHARRIIDSMESRGMLSRGVVGWGHELAGYVVSMPAYYAGSPECMLMRSQEAMHEGAPVRVVYDCMISAGVGHEEINNRGTAVLALILALQTMRPVSLEVVACLDAKDCTEMTTEIVEIPTAALDVTQLSYVLTSSSIARRMFMGLAAPHGYMGGWGWGARPGSRMNAMMRAALYMSPTDIYIGPGSLGAQRLMLSDPVQWVSNEIERHKTLDPWG